MNKTILNIAILGDSPAFASRVEEMFGVEPVLAAAVVFYSSFEEFSDDVDRAASFDLLLLELAGSEAFPNFVELSRRYPALPKIVFGEVEDIEFSERILSAGAHDFLIKNQTSAEILKRTISHALVRQDFHHRLITKTDQFQMAAKMARLGNWEVDFEPTTVFWSEEVCMIHDVKSNFVPTLEEAIGYYVPEHQDQVKSAFEECLATGNPFSGEWEIISAKGNQVWVKVMGSCVRDGTGKVIKVHGTLQDVTDRVLSRTHLQLLQECIRHLNDAVIVCDVAEMGGDAPKIRFVNEAFTEMTGYSSGEVVGLTPDFLQGEETDKNVVRAIGRALYRAKPIRKELVIYDKEGKPCWIETEISPISDSHGKLSHFVGVQRDISERKMRESTASFQARILDTVSQSVLVTDPAGAIIHANGTAEKYFGYSIAELVGRQVTDVSVADSDVESARGALAKVRQGGDWTGEILAKHSSGREFPVLLSASAIHDEDGSLDKMLVFATDITDSREIKEALRRSLKDNIDLKQALNRHVIVSVTNLDGVITFVNEKFCEISGYSEEELVGNCHFILDGDRKAPAYSAEMLAALTSGNSWKGEIKSYRKDGTIFWTDTTVVPFLDDSGRPRQYLSLRSDITARKKAEEELRFQASFIARSHDAIMATDLNNRITFWNQAAEKTYGWTSKEADGRLLCELLKCRGEEFENAFNTVKKAGEWSGELTFLTKSGADVIVEASWTLVSGDGVREDSIFSINKDITGARELERQFFRSQRMESVGRLAGGIAHDLNNMLTPILLSVDILREAAIPKSSMAIMDTLEGSARRAAELVKQVLMFSKGVEGKRKPVRIEEIIDEVASISAETFPKNITVHRDVEETVNQILGDRTQIHQILMNLCVNACDAMEEGGHLSIHLGMASIDSSEANVLQDVEEGRYVVVSVEDTGMGIPPETMDKIFDPFFTTKEIGKGSGIGLSTSLAIVKSHGGFMDVRSEAGKGTNFKVYLPASESVESSVEAPPCIDSLQRGSGELILLIDDEIAIRTIGKKILERSGYRVLIANNGAEGVAMFAKQKDEISAVITDMAMPVMDGNALVVALRRIDPHVRTLVMSGHTTSGRYLGEGTETIHHFIPKPFSTETLLPAVAKLLSEDADEPVALAQ
ncbi:MAG: PAS domain S-box protein [Verrucomicrobiales bacterium]|nr:PAS domain S-box protein [Verrucomicrobiales bacterium]